MPLNYLVGYRLYNNFVSNVVDITWQRNIHPREDSFEIQVSNIGANTPQAANPFLLLTTNSPLGEQAIVAREVWVYRVDNTNNSTLVFRGVVTKTHYAENAHTGWDIIMEGTGLWYTLQTRMVAIPNASFTGYLNAGTQNPIPNPWIPILNPILNFNFEFLFNVIINNFSNQSSMGLLSTIVSAGTNGTDFSSAYARLISQANAGDITISAQNFNIVTNTYGGSLQFQGATSTTDPNGNTVYVGGDLIYIAGSPPDPNNLANPPVGETAVVFSVNQVTNTITLAAPLAQSHPSGTFVWNRIVNDNMYMQYTTVDATLERLMQAGVNTSDVSQGNGAVGELSLDFVGTTDPQGLGRPTLSAKLFNPNLVSGGVHTAMGVGTDRTVQNGSLPPITYYEGDDLVDFQLSYDYEEMANSLVFSGEQFRGAEIAAAEKRDDTSIITYGLKQMHKSAGNVADPTEIQRYMQNIFPITAQPIPSMSAWLLNEYPNTYLPNPGDLINIQSPSLQGIIITQQPSSPNFAIRIKSINTKWNTDDGEKVQIEFTFPLTQAGQWLSNFSSHSPQTVIGNLQQELRTATYHSGDSIIENKILSVPFVIKDRTIAPNGILSIFPQSYVYPLHLHTNTVINSALSNTSIAPTIYGLWITPTSTKAFTTVTVTLNGMNSYATVPISAIHLQVVQPDGLIIYESDIAMETKLDLLSIISQSYGVSSGSIGGSNVPVGPVLQNAVHGDYLLVFSNTSAGSTYYNLNITSLTPPITGVPLPLALTTPIPDEVPYTMVVETAYLAESTGQGRVTGSNVSGGTSGGGGSVVAGTMVLMADRSLKKIEDINVGDIVMGFDTDKLVSVPSTVKETYAIPTSIIYTINDNLIRCDDIQPFLTRGGWLKAKRLRIDDELYNPMENKWIVITSIDIERKEDIVYDIRMEPCINYIANGVVITDIKVVGGG